MSPSASYPRPPSFRCRPSTAWFCAPSYPAGTRIDIQNRRYALRAAARAARRSGQPQVRADGDAATQAGRREELGETANLATLDGDRVIYVSQAPSPHAMRMFTEVGRRSYLHSTSVGKAILAGMTDEQVREIVARTGMPANTEHTITDVESLLADLAKTRKRGSRSTTTSRRSASAASPSPCPTWPYPPLSRCRDPSPACPATSPSARPVLEEIVAEIAVTTNQ